MGKPVSLEHPRMRVMGNLTGNIPGRIVQTKTLFVSKLRKKIRDCSRRLIVSEWSQKNEYNPNYN
jgi:hypothetical protein